MAVRYLSGVVGTTAQGVASTDFQAGVQTVSALQALDENSRADKQIRLLEDKGNSYRFDAQSTATTDGDEVIRPDDVSSDSSAGRWVKIVGLGGDAVGPASSTDNAVVRYSGTGGKTLQNSTVTISDTGTVAVTSTSGSGASGVTVTQQDVSNWCYRGSGARLGAHIDVLRSNAADVVLRVGDSSTIDLLEIKGADGGAAFKTPVTVGVNDSGHDVVLHGDTASANVTWDASADDLILNGAAGVVIPEGQLTLGSTAVTSTATELNLMDGITAIDTDLSSVSGQDDTLASAKSIKTYVDAQVTAQDLDITTDDGTNTGIDLDSETLTISGGEGIDTSATGNTVTIAAEEATDSNKGVASFAAADFSVSSGAVSLVDLTVSHIAAATLVTESEGIGSNDNDTTLPTSAAVKDYVDTNVTAQDLDIQGDSGGALSVDLDSETLTIAGGTGITTTGANETISVAVDAAQTGITSLLATDIKIGEDDQTKVDFGTANEIEFYADNAKRVTIDATGLTVNSGSIETATIDYTDGDNAMTIADGGKVTFSAGFDVGSDAAGDILYHNGTSYVRLAKGSADQVLTMNDAANAPGWEDASGGSGTITALNNQTANRLVTIGATTTELDGEAGLTYDGTELAVSSSTSDKPVFSLTNTNADANPATINFVKTSGSVANDDELGEIVFNGNDDGGSSTMFAKMVVASDDVANGSEDGSVTFKIRTGGAIAEPLSLNAGGNQSAKLGGGLILNRTDKDTTSVTAYTVLPSDYYIGIHSSGSAQAITLTLPAVANVEAGQTYVVKDEGGDASGSTITVDGDGSETIDGATSVTITTDYGALSIYCTGSAWSIV